MAQHLQLDISSDDQTPRLVVAGDLDLSSKDELVGALTELCEGSGRTVEVDLSGVTFMDSSGLSALVQAHRLSAEHSCQLVVQNPPEQVRGLFEITGVDQLLTVVGGTEG